jgi:hypothetical protein
MKYNYDYIFPEWKYNRHLDKPIKTGKVSQVLTQFREKDPFSYSQIPQIDNIDLIGYFQNENYFSCHKKEIVDLFDPNDVIKSKVYLTDFDGLTAIHVRRGDYLNFPLHHPVPSLSYYNTAISNLKNISKNFMVFSDDIPWCKEQFPSNFLYSEETDEFIDLFKMSLCSNFIIANSSFSWWGSYLSKNPSKKIYAPDNWVGRGYSGTGWRQVYRKEMIIL